QRSASVRRASPSTAMSAPSSTFSSGRVSTAPSAVTRPARMASRASLREKRPLAAISLSSLVSIRDLAYRRNGGNILSPWGGMSCESLEKCQIHAQDRRAGDNRGGGAARRAGAAVQRRRGDGNDGGADGVSGLARL